MSENLFKLLDEFQKFATKLKVQEVLNEEEV